MKTESVSLVIPAYNEVDNLVPLYGQIVAVIDKMPCTAEIIIVDDGSRDNSGATLRELTKRDPRVRVIIFARNYGQTAAMGAGIKHAKGEVILPLDADMQNDPTDIPRLIAKLEEGYDIVSGWRKSRKDEFLRMLLSRMANRLIVRTTGVDIHDYGCTLKAYRSTIVKNIDFYGEIHRLIPVYASWQGAKITEIEVSHHPRKFGHSKYGFSRIGKLLLDLLVVKYFISYAQRPIYFFGWLGILSFTGGFLSFALAVFLRFVYHISFILTPLPLLTALFFLAGLQLLSMGIIADMIIRTRANKEQIIYSIKEKINLD